MISTTALIEKFRQALSEGWGYIYGASGETWTASKQAAATREQTVKWGSRWIGRRVADCSGLFVWAFKQLGGTMYHGSNTMYKKWSTASGKLVSGKREDGQELKPGSAVYKWNADTGYHHVGLYVGDGMVIEAKGTFYGVVQSKVTEWSYWSELKGVAYDGTVEPEEKESDPMTGACKVTAPNGGGVNVREKASTSASKLDTLPTGTEIEVIEDNGEWCRIKYTKTGYMASKYIKEV